jgi:hypothetical protein
MAGVMLALLVLPAPFEPLNEGETTALATLLYQQRELLEAQERELIVLRPLAVRLRLSCVGAVAT